MDYINKYKIVSKFISILCFFILVFYSNALFANEVNLGVLSVNFNVQGWSLYDEQSVEDMVSFAVREKRVSSGSFSVIRFSLEKKWPLREVEYLALYVIDDNGDYHVESRKGRNSTESSIGGCDTLGSTGYYGYTSNIGYYHDKKKQSLFCNKFFIKAFDDDDKEIMILSGKMPSLNVSLKDRNFQESNDFKLVLTNVCSKEITIDGLYGEDDGVIIRDNVKSLKLSPGSYVEVKVELNRELYDERANDFKSNIEVKYRRKEKITSVKIVLGSNVIQEVSDQNVSNWSYFFLGGVATTATIFIAGKAYACNVLKAKRVVDDVEEIDEFEDNRGEEESLSEDEDDEEGDDLVEEGGDGGDGGDESDDDPDEQGFGDGASILPAAVVIGGGENENENENENEVEVEVEVEDRNIAPLETENFTWRGRTILAGAVFIAGVVMAEVVRGLLRRGGEAAADNMLPDLQENEEVEFEDDDQIAAYNTWDMWPDLRVLIMALLN